MSIAKDNSLYQRIDEALDTIRPHLEIDGGNIEIVSISDKMEVEIRWLGNCEFCSMSAMTMKAGVEQAIKSMVPEVISVKALNGVV
jgi:Fe-S cluster biogenesis protein NfuA